MFGLPQGSVLGPFLFIVFINDLFTTLSHLELWAFADDTKLFLPISSSSDVTVFLSQVTEILKWFKDNGLVVSSGKCKSVNFYFHKNVLKNIAGLTLLSSIKLSTWISFLTIN